MELTELFKSGESVVTSPGRACQTGESSRACHAFLRIPRVSQVMANVRKFLSIRVFGPKPPLGAAKIRNT
ncbi:MAG: hypothetical protein Ct9H300mP14_10010 [Gammaproteobacteria bacterium]|nr:MAG: hypothetical protein Ct9H300mP14_10010 [Gammaproteobacteria bacterium]